MPAFFISEDKDNNFISSKKSRKSEISGTLLLLHFEYCNVNLLK